MYIDHGHSADVSSLAQRSILTVSASWGYWGAAAHRAIGADAGMACITPSACPYCACTSPLALGWS